MAWIKAFDTLYYDNLGKYESFDVKWFDDPPQWTEADNSSNTIGIELSSTDIELHNPLQYKITFYITTGTIQVQGNHKDLFVTDHFPILKSLVNMVIEAQLSTDSSTKAACEVESDSDSDDSEVQLNTEHLHKTDDEVTYLKTLCQF